MDSIEASQISKAAASKMDKAVEHVNHEFSTIHTGKASPTMVEGLLVDAYGSQMRMKETAAISTPDSRSIRIEPWDKGLIKEIEKAIIKANIGLNPVVDGHVVRCPIPELSGERRKEMVKMCNKMAEDGRIQVRGVRREALDKIKKDQKASLISEDDLARFEKDVQNETDKHIKEIDAHFANKEKELMQV